MPAVISRAAAMAVERLSPALIHRPAHGVDQVQLPQGEVFPGQAGGLRLQDLAKHLHQKLVEHLSAALHPDRPLCIRS